LLYLTFVCRCKSLSVQLRRSHLLHAVCRIIYTTWYKLIYNLSRYENSIWWLTLR